MKVKKLVSLVTSIVICLSCAFCAHAEVWSVEEWIQFIKKNHRDIRPANKDYVCWLCVVNYTFLAEYSLKLRIGALPVDPLEGLPERLRKSIDVQLRQAKELSKENYGEWLYNLSVLRIAFECLWRQIVFDECTITLMDGDYELYASPPNAEHFKSFAEEKACKEGVPDKEEILCKCLALDGYIRCLSALRYGLDVKSLATLGEKDIGIIRVELEEAKNYFKDDEKSLMAALRTMRDKYWLIFSTAGDTV